MVLHLVDTNASLVAAWLEAFAGFPEVVIERADILSVAKHCLVSPANSMGFMDGGIDQQYLAFFGGAIQDRVQEAIARRPEGHLPVGASLTVTTGHPRVPYLIVAPTMPMPERVESDNAYRAMRAILRIVSAQPRLGNDVYCPGLATGTGMVPAKDAAEAMAEAYRDWKSAASHEQPQGPASPDHLR
jgi:O-acetyl-ADP-ribose deacetylase (regulator of RNase III)